MHTSSNLPCLYSYEVHLLVVIRKVLCCGTPNLTERKFEQVTFPVPMTSYTGSFIHPTPSYHNLLRPTLHCSAPRVLDTCTFSTEEEKQTLLSNIRHCLTPHPVKLRAGMKQECVREQWYQQFVCVCVCVCVSCGGVLLCL